MKRSVWMWVVAALFMSLTMTIGAQVPYVVQPGDTGWELSRQYYNNPTTWQRIVDMNPVLQRPGRVFETTNPDTGEKKIILLLKLGEQLLGLERLNVSPPVAVPIEELVKTESAGVDEVVTIPAKAVFDWLKWLAVAGLVAFVLLVVWSAITDPLRNQSRERELQQDPVTSGPPIIAGGVQPNETERLTRTLEAAAVSDYVRLNPTVDRDTVHVERIGPVEEGTISGEGMVGYADRA
ncbi:MAG TPA: LysM domain-containing protein, partial [Candidatus Paceibacterota bacterium]